MIAWEEILVANGVTMIMMGYLLMCRKKNRENVHTEDKFYDGMAYINLLGAFFETVSFYVDGKDTSWAYFLNYMTSSISFFCTVSIALLWCIYVELRIYRNYKKIFGNLKIIMIPWEIEIVAIVINLFGTGFLFRISSDNVYQRSDGAILGYISIMIYFAYSIYLVFDSKKQGINLNFFPVHYFVGPCLAGVLIQLFFYGITTSWISVALALAFVQMQMYAENVYTDELSGLYNRRYLNFMLTKKETLSKKSLYGIMLDIDDFKSINDDFGHNVGDQAICAMGDILFKSIPEQSIAVRYAGDEFVVLLVDEDEIGLNKVIEEINKNISLLNESKKELFTLSASIGCAKFVKEMNIEDFLACMDKDMYSNKNNYHLKRKISPEEDEFNG